MRDEGGLGRELLGLFVARGPDGRYLYTEEDVLRFVPVLIRSTGTVSPWLKPLLRRLTDLIGVSEGADAQTVSAALEAHYTAHPVAPGLLQGFARLLREHGAAEMADAVGALNRLGGEPASLEGLRAPRDPTASPLSVLMRAKTEVSKVNGG